MTLKERMQKLIEILQKDLYEREEVISLSLLAGLAGQNVFFLGPPGTAKSLIARRLAKVFDTKHYFEYLMQKFSTPEEVFGPISIAELKKDNYVRKIQGFLPEAEVAFLDEIWKASPAILNTLLTIINEKTFKNGLETLSVPLKMLISASNELPDQNLGLEALYDRFLLRFYIPPIRERQNFETILQNGSTQVDPQIDDKFKISTDEWKKWKEQLKETQLSEDTLHLIHAIRLAIEKRNKEHPDKKPIYVSDRRWQQAALLLKASAFFCNRTTTNIGDVFILTYCLWSQNDHRLEIEKIVKTAIKENGFDTGVSLAELDSQKETLEQEITRELFYTEDLYREEIIDDNYNINSHNMNNYYDTPDPEFYEEYDDEEEYIPNEDAKHFIIELDNYDKSVVRHNKHLIPSTIYIPKKYWKKTDTFQPVDIRGKILQHFQCSFDNQGSLQVYFRPYAYNNNWNLLGIFTPVIEFHKGDRKSKVSSRLKKSFRKDIELLKKEFNKFLSTVKAKKKAFQEEIENPFIVEEHLNFALESVDAQIDSLKIRIKDCERLKGLLR